MRRSKKSRCDWRWSVAVGVCLASGVVAATAEVPESNRTDGPPNFVIIFTDDQGYQDAGCFGSPDIRTPRLDRLAREGMRFTSFYAQPICGPSRAAIMTGCYPMRVAEEARADIGDYNRIGRRARFFDDGPKRPDAAKWIE